MANERDKLDLNVLKGALGADDFGLMGERDNGEIDSIADLDVPATPVTPAADADKDKHKDDISGIQEFEEDVPTDDANENDNNQSAEDKSKADTKVPVVKADALKLFGENLGTKGLLDFNPEEFDKAEDKEAFLYAKTEETINKRAEEKFQDKYSDLPPEIDRLIELHKEGVPLSKVLEADDRIDTLEGIKPADIESNVDLQKDILRELLGSQGFAADKIEAKIKRYEDLASLKDEALEGFDSLLGQEKKQRELMIQAEKAKKIEATNKAADRVKAIEADINKRDEIIPGFKISPEEKKALIEGITKVVGKDKQGRPINGLAKARMDDPDMDLKTAYFTLILKGDLGKLKQKAATTTTRSIKSLLDSTDTLGTGQAGIQSTSNKPDLEVIKRSMAALKRTY